MYNGTQYRDNNNNNYDNEYTAQQKIRQNPDSCKKIELGFHFGT